MTSRISAGALATMLATALFFTASAAIPSAYTVGTWGNFCQGAISHTFDDYGMGGVTNAAGSNGTGEAAFDAKGFHSTIFVVTGQASTTTWNNLKYAFSKGHEIASHTVSHSSSSSELVPSQNTIKTNVPGEKCATIAYPNCQTPGDAEVLKYYIAGRICGGTLNSKSPTNFAQIDAKGFGSGSGNYPNDANSMNSFADQAASNKGWAVCMHHGIGSDTHSWAVTKLDALTGHLDYLDKNRDKIWIETFGNVARYIKERDAVSITETSQADTFVVQITDNLADSIFNYPLSIRRELPSGWTKATVTQKGVVVKDTIVTASGKSYIQFQAVPDGGNVVIKSGSVAVIKEAGAFRTNNASPVARQNATLVIDTRHFNGSSLNVTFFNLNGKAVAHYNLGANESNVALPMNKIGNSAFIVKIKGGSKSYTGKFVASL